MACLQHLMAILFYMFYNIQYSKAFTSINDITDVVYNIATHFIAISIISISIWLLPHFPSPSADLSHWPGRSHRDVPSNDPMGCGMDDMG